MQTSAKHIIDYAKLPETSPLKDLYKSERFMSLIQTVTGLEKVYTSSCPYNAAYLNVYADTHGLGWHFDRSEFGVNLVLAAPSNGGGFEFHHNTRSAEDMTAFAEVQNILQKGSEHQGVVKVGPLVRGDIVIFNGRLSM